MQRNKADTGYKMHLVRRHYEPSDGQMDGPTGRPLICVGASKKEKKLPNKSLRIVKFLFLLRRQVHCTVYINLRWGVTSVSPQEDNILLKFLSVSLKAQHFTWLCSSSCSIISRFRSFLFYIILISVKQNSILQPVSVGRLENDSNPLLTENLSWMTLRTIQFLL